MSAHDLRLESEPPPSSAATAAPGAHDKFVGSLLGTRVGGRYDILRVIAAGGMGVVVEARYPDLDQSVALKVMFPELCADRVLCQRFAREAKLAARVRSPHLVRVSDVGTLDGGVPFLVMELLSGRDLSMVVEQDGPLAVTDAVDYLLQAACGIAELHALGVVHRDLKPSNLFLADVAGVPTIKILDFGISKEASAASTKLTSTESLLGTPAYMSPEQITATKTADFRSDVWSLGVILYELLTGKIPFDTKTDGVGELLALVLTAEPVPLRQRRFNLPVELEGVVMKCLRKKADERYPSVAELAEALRSFAPGASLHRIDAVKRTLGRTDVSSEPRMQREGYAAPIAETQLGPARRAEGAPLKVTSTAGLSIVARAAAPIRRAQILAAVGALVLIMGALVGVRALRGSSGASTESAAPAGIVPVAAAKASPDEAERLAPLPSTFVAPAAAVPTKAAPTVDSLETDPAGARLAAKPQPRAAHSRAAAPAAAASTRGPAPSRDDDLILDRK